MIVRRALPADANAAAAAFTASFASTRFVPKLHGADEDRAFVRALIARKERPGAGTIAVWENLHGFHEFAQARSRGIPVQNLLHEDEDD